MPLWISDTDRRSPFRTISSRNFAAMPALVNRIMKTALPFLAAGALTLLTTGSAFAQVAATTDAAGTASNATGFATGEGVSTEITRTGAIGQSSAAPIGQPAAAGGTAGGAAGGGFGGLGGLGGGLGGLGGLFGGAFGAAGGQTNTPAIRTRLRSAVEVPPRSVGRVQQSVNRTLYQLPPRAYNPGLSVRVVDRTAVLQGTVRSEKDRRMSELLMRLEPGVSSVRNDLTVQP